VLGAKRVLGREGPRLEVTTCEMLSVIRFYVDGLGRKPHSFWENGATKFMFILSVGGRGFVRCLSVYLNIENVLVISG